MHLGLRERDERGTVAGRAVQISCGGVLSSLRRVLLAECLGLACLACPESSSTRVGVACCCCLLCWRGGFVLWL